MLRANERAVARALLATLRPDRNGVWPFEVITIGGDDVLLFVPADRALPLASRIARDFTDAMQERAITLSVGVLLMPDHTPVRFAVDLAEQLLKSAKRCSTEHTNVVKPPTLDVMALKEVTMVAETIADYRAVALRRTVQTARSRANRRETVHLTQRPYLLDELDTLLAACRDLEQARFPRSQLYQLRQIIEQGQVAQSVIDYHYSVGRGQRRANDTTAYTRFAAQVAALCGDRDRAWPPWRITEHPAQGAYPAQTIYETPLLDLIELAPFVADETAAAGAKAAYG
jgi:CRISPR-associated protein Cmr2